MIRRSQLVPAAAGEEGRDSRRQSGQLPKLDSAGDASGPRRSALQSGQKRKTRVSIRFANPSAAWDHAESNSSHASPQHLATSTASSGKASPRSSSPWSEQRRSVMMPRVSLPSVKLARLNIQRGSSDDESAPTTALQARARALWDKVRSHFENGSFHECGVDGTPGDHALAPAAERPRKPVTRQTTSSPAPELRRHRTRKSLYEPMHRDTVTADPGGDFHLALASSSEAEHEPYTSAPAKGQFHSRNIDENLRIIQTSKVMHAIPVKLQVQFSRRLQLFEYGGGDEPTTIIESGDSSTESRKLRILKEGHVEVVIKTADRSEEVVVGREGPGHVFGGLFAMGLTQRHLLSVRCARVTNPNEQDSAPNKGPNSSATNSEPIPAFETCVLGEINSQQLQELEDTFQQEMNILRRRVLHDARHKLMPCLLRLIYSGHFFRRYGLQFVKRLTKDMDMRIFKPGELVFKEKHPARHMAVLLSGTIDISQEGRKIRTTGQPGHFFGEAAVLDQKAMRTATVRCGQEGEALICLLAQNMFRAALEDFPEEKSAFAEHVRLKFTSVALGDIFRGALPTFLHLVATSCEIIHLGWGKGTALDDQEEEVLHLVLHGSALVEWGDGSFQVLNRGEHIGLEAGLGISRGMKDYRIIATKLGCSLIRMPYQALERALYFFPRECPKVYKAIGQDVPADNPVMFAANVYSVVRPLLCQFLCTESIDTETVKELAPLFFVDVYDSGTTIMEEDAPSDQLLFLVMGEVRWEREGILTTHRTAPWIFDDAVLLGLQSHHTATVTATSICVAWHLKLKSLEAAAKEEGSAASRIWHILQDTAAFRKKIQSTLQAKLRNMKTFRKFRSGVLELMCKNMDVRTFLPGKTIMTKGEEGEDVYILLKGKAGSVQDGKTITLTEGSTFGEMVMFGQDERTATVKATTLCVCNVVHKDFFLYAFKKCPMSLELPDAGANQTPTSSGSTGNFNKWQKNLKTLAPVAAFKNALGGSAAPSIAPSVVGSAAPSAAPSAKQSLVSTRSAQQSTDLGSIRKWWSLHGFAHAKKTDVAKDDDSQSSSSSSDEGAGTVSVGKVILDAVDSEDNGEEVSFELPDARNKIYLGPSALMERNANRSCLFDVRAPQIPPAEEWLYLTPRADTVLEAFQQALPRDAVTAVNHTARMRGLPGTYREDMSWPLRERIETIFVGGRRVHRTQCQAAFTNPLPPLARRTPIDQVQLPSLRSKEADLSVAIAGNLQVLASSLHRIHNKDIFGDLRSPSEGEDYPSNLSLESHRVQGGADSSAQSLPSVFNLSQTRSLLSSVTSLGGQKFGGSSDASSSRLLAQRKGGLPPGRAATASARRRRKRRLERHYLRPIRRGQGARSDCEGGTRMQFGAQGAVGMQLLSNSGSGAALPQAIINEAAEEDCESEESAGDEAAPPAWEALQEEHWMHNTRRDSRRESCGEAGSGKRNSEEKIQRRRASQELAEEEERKKIELAALELQAAIEVHEDITPAMGWNSRERASVEEEGEYMPMQASMVLESESSEDEFPLPVAVCQASTNRAIRRLAYTGAINSMAARQESPKEDPRKFYWQLCASVQRAAEPQEMEDSEATGVEPLDRALSVEDEDIEDVKEAGNEALERILLGDKDGEQEIEDVKTVKTRMHRVLEALERALLRDQPAEDEDIEDFEALERARLGDKDEEQDLEDVKATGIEALEGALLYDEDQETEDMKATGVEALERALLGNLSDEDQEASREDLRHFYWQLLASVDKADEPQDFEDLKAAGIEALERALLRDEDQEPSTADLPKFYWQLLASVQKADEPQASLQPRPPEGPRPPGAGGRSFNRVHPSQSATGSAGPTVTPCNVSRNQEILRSRLAKLLSGSSRSGDLSRSIVELTATVGAKEAAPPPGPRPSGGRGRTRQHFQAPEHTGAGEEKAGGFAGEWDEATISADLTTVTWKNGDTDSITVRGNQLEMTMDNESHEGMLVGDRIEWSDGDIWKRVTVVDRRGSAAEKALGIKALERALSNRSEEALGFAGEWPEATICMEANMITWKDGRINSIRVAGNRIRASMRGYVCDGILEGDEIKWSDGDVWTRVQA